MREPDFVRPGTSYWLRQTEDGRWCVQWQTATMAAPAFVYFATHEQAVEYCTKGDPK